MRFWDSSAVVPLLVWEGTTEAVQALSTEDPMAFIWWGTEVECASAISRLEREGAIDGETTDHALRRLKTIVAAWHEIEPTDLVREAAVRFVRVHQLRAADALQLAAAFVASDRRPSSLEVVTLDTRLRTAAQKEGFRTPLIGGAPRAR